MDKTVRPGTLRDAKIKSIRRGGEDEAYVEMENGNTHSLDIDELLDDWLYLHRQRQTHYGDPDQNIQSYAIS